jgi:hypothetical protein
MPYNITHKMNTIDCKNTQTREGNTTTPGAEKMYVEWKLPETEREGGKDRSL